MEPLRKVQALTGTLHLCSAVLFLSLSGEYTVPVSIAGSNFSNVDSPVAGWAREYEISPPLLVALAAFISASHHFAAAIFYDFYKSVTYTFAVFRWTDYIISSSCLVLAAQVMNGDWALQSLIAAFVLMVCTIMYGATADLNKNSWEGVAFYLMGWVPFTAVILMQALTLDASNELNGIPDGVWGLIVYLQVLFCSFGVVGGLMHAGLVSPMRAELAYLSLSLTAKTGLQWLLYSATERVGTVAAVASSISVAGIAFGIAVFYYTRNMNFYDTH